jgi:serine/threonine-protein kinase RsbW
MAPLPANVRLARLVGSGLASQACFGAEDIEDARISIDEACTSVLTAEPIDSLTLHFDVSQREIAMEISAPVRNPPQQLQRVSREILDAVTAEWHLTVDGSVMTIVVRAASRSGDGAT